MLPPRNTLWEEQIFSPLCAQVFFILLFQVVCPQVVSLPSAKNSTVPSMLYPTQASWPLKLQALSTTCCKNPWISAPFVFQANGFGDLLCAPLSLDLPHKHSSLPSIEASVYFPPKPCLCASYLLWCGLFSPFGCEVCSVRLQVDFWDI